MGALFHVRRMAPSGVLPDPPRPFCKPDDFPRLYVVHTTAQRLEFIPHSLGWHEGMISYVISLVNPHGRGLKSGSSPSSCLERTRPSVGGAGQVAGSEARCCRCFGCYNDRRRGDREADGAALEKRCGLRSPWVRIPPPPPFLEIGRWKLEVGIYSNLSPLTSDLQLPARRGAGVVDQARLESV